jgi:hypothetical protein
MEHTKSSISSLNVVWQRFPARLQLRLFNGSGPRWLATLAHLTHDGISSFTNIACTKSFWTTNQLSKSVLLNIWNTVQIWTTLTVLTLNSLISNLWQLKEPYIRFEALIAVDMQYLYLLVGLSFEPEDGGDMLLRTFHWVSLDYTALYPRRQNSPKERLFHQVTAVATLLYISWL